MRAEKKSDQTFKSAKNADGYLIVTGASRYYSETLHLAASAIAGFKADDFGGTIIPLPQIDKDAPLEIKLSMPLECAQYFLHLAKQGMHVDLSAYSGRYTDKQIRPNSPEHHKFRLPVQKVTPDELSNMRHNFISTAPKQHQPSVPKDREKEATEEKNDLDRFPFLSEAERAKMQAEAARRKKYKL